MLGTPSPLTPQKDRHKVCMRHMVATGSIHNKPLIMVSMTTGRSCAHSNPPTPSGQQVDILSCQRASGQKWACAGDRGPEDRDQGVYQKQDRLSVQYTSCQRRNNGVTCPNSGKNNKPYRNKRTSFFFIWGENITNECFLLKGVGWLKKAIGNFNLCHLLGACSTKHYSSWRWSQKQ